MNLFQKGILAGAGSILCTGISVLTNIILSRCLLPEGMGRYQIPFTASVLLITFLGLGIGQANIYFLNKHKIDERQIVINSFWVGCWSVAGLVLAHVILFTVFRDYFGHLSLWIRILVGFGGSAAYMSNLLRPVLIADMRIRQTVYAQLGSCLTSLLAILILAISGGITVETALLAGTLGYFIDVFMNFLYVRDRIEWKRRFSFPVFWKTLWYGLRIFAANFVYVVNVQIGVLLLRFFIPDDFSSVGYYTRATTLCNLVLLFPLAVGPILYARWSGVSGEQRVEQVGIAMRMHIAISIVMIAFLYPLSPFIICLFFGKAFLPAVPAMRVLVLAVCFRCIFNVCQNLLSGDGRAELTAYLLGGNVIFISILTYFLVRPFGIVGAAMADVLGSFLVLVIGFYILKRDYGLMIHRSLLLNRGDMRYLFASVFNCFS